MKLRTRNLSTSRPLVTLGLLALVAAGCNEDPSGAGETDTESGTGNSETMPTDPSGTMSGTDSDTDGDTDSDTDGPNPEGFVPLPGGMRKLTSREYTASIDVMLGDGEIRERLHWKSRPDDERLYKCHLDDVSLCMSEIKERNIRMRR